MGDGIVTGLKALLTHLAENPLVARLLFIEALSGGPVALDTVEKEMDRLSGMFSPSAIPSDVGTPPPEIALEAIGAGIYVVIQHEVAEGRIEALPELVPEIAFIALAPFEMA